jgi:small GTP-binding protein
LRGLLSKKENATPTEPGDAVASRGDSHLELARESLTALLDDDRVPAAVRNQLATDYDDVRRMLDKLENGHVHIAAFGRVGVGKSSVLNALLGETRFSTSPLHGETRKPGFASWHSEQTGGVFLVDTPGIDEIGGESREVAARAAAMRSDLLLFVVDGDMTAAETAALEDLVASGRPVLLVLNKCDRYRTDEISLLMTRLAERAADQIEARNIIAVAADPRAAVRNAPGEGDDKHGEGSEPDVSELRERLWTILEEEGKTLAAVNASLFAGHLSDAVGVRVVEARRTLAENLVRTYCIAKGVAVAFNPVPVADLFAAAAIDAGMVVHLSRLYGLPLTSREAGSLISVVVTQMAALMGTVWAVHLVSSALKLGTGGMSIMLTAGAQGAVAYYSTYVVGRAAERYFAQGKSWGDSGPQLVVEEILESVDRDSVLRQAKLDIRARLSS